MTRKELQLKDAYAFIKSKDPRFDGRFYWGIKTTKVYCRPTCSANPSIHNIKIYRSKAEAENAGLRPCLRCRPDISPTSPLWEGTAAVVSRALKLISNSPNLNSMTELSEKLGMSDRHLRRLFEEHLGAAPMDVVLSNRLHVARHLLSQTEISITEIAFASGFQSLRRFNDAFKKKYQKSPRDYRKNPKKNNANQMKMTIPFLQPLDWNYLLRFFEIHCVDGGEYIENQKYYRAIKIEDRVITICVSCDGKNIVIETQDATASDLRAIVKQVRFAFDLEHNPAVIFKEKDLMKNIKKWDGLRIPGCFDPFETAVSIILGQLVSTKQAKQKIKKLMDLSGESVETPNSRLYRVFPSPEKILKTDLRQLGITQIRAEAIYGLSKMVLDKKIDLSTSCSIPETREKLLSIKGIGPWTVEMVALRCLGDTNAYPEKDLIIDRAIKKMKIKSKKWEPWRAYLTLWIWNNYAEQLTKKKVKK